MASDESKTPDTTTATTAETSAYEQDQKTRAQMEAIEKEIKSKQKLTSDLLPLSKLIEIYDANQASKTIGSDNISNDNGGNQNFINGSLYLNKKYKNWRMVRGDGNCYYRAFLYAICEECLRGCLNSSNDNIDFYKTELKRLQSYGTSNRKKV